MADFCHSVVGACFPAYEVTESCTDEHSISTNSSTHAEADKISDACTIAQTHTSTVAGANSTHTVPNHKTNASTDARNVSDTYAGVYVRRRDVWEVHVGVPRRVLQ